MSKLDLKVLVGEGGLNQSSFLFFFVLENNAPDFLC